MTSCIKFIATDIDGTLLSDTNELPCDFFDVFKALDEKMYSLLQLLDVNTLHC